MDSRIYIVRRIGADKMINEERLVRASHRTAALRHVVENTHEVVIASQTDLVRLLSAGVGVETPAADRQLSLVD